MTDRWRSVCLRWEAHRARIDERRAQQRLGEALVAARESSARTRPSFDEVAEFSLDVAAIESAMADSLDDDRNDFGAVAAWIRPLVILRGLAVRAVLRHRLLRARKERAAACGRLGAVALSAGPLDGNGTVAEAAAAARAGRSRIDAAQAAERKLLAPFGGALFPGAVRRAGRESFAFSKTVAKELRGQFLPRLPALAGLLAGWWIATTFTDSQFSATLHSWGIGSGPRRAVSSETLSAMKFWLPILAAALCSYAGGRLGALVRSRYALPRRETEQG
jgi:hypothetical protein